MFCRYDRCGYYGNLLGLSRHRHDYQSPVRVNTLDCIYEGRAVCSREMYVFQEFLSPSLYFISSAVNPSVRFDTSADWGLPASGARKDNPSRLMWRDNISHVITIRVRTLKVSSSLSVSHYVPHLPQELTPSWPRIQHWGVINTLRRYKLHWLDSSTFMNLEWAWASALTKHSLLYMKVDNTVLPHINKDGKWWLS